MNSFLIIANIITLLSLFVHVFYGDKDIRSIEPEGGNLKKLENWIMARGAFHVFSADLLMFTIGLTLINFTSLLDEHRTMLLMIMSIWLLFYAVFFFVTVLISKPLSNKFLKLFQWAVFIAMSGLIYLGI
ncbi:MAG: hypothetical protein EOO04_07865 [Chitinophagaceae bacterium]|nr:MAG: hypothetical protein EOO04_07865 [Chitinophagaceae bacterium]